MELKEIVLICLGYCLEWLVGIGIGLGIIYIYNII